MAKNDLPNVAKAATNINLYAVQLTPAVTQINPNAQQTTALLQGITSQNDTITLFGDTGADQQPRPSTPCIAALPRARTSPRTPTP